MGLRPCPFCGSSNVSAYQSSFFVEIAELKRENIRLMSELLNLDANCAAIRRGMREK